MTTVQDILEFVETLAPRSMKMDWDNVGLLCGRRDRAVTRLYVALDPFPETCRKAAEAGAQVLVTHHPLFFRPAYAVTEDSIPGQSALFLIEHGMAAINAHTNLDQAPGGVNDCLARALGLEDVTVLDPQGVDGAGRPWGLLRMGSLPQAEPLEAFLARVQRALGAPGLRYVDGGGEIRRVAVGGGACGDEWELARRAGCDAMVTADVKYNQFCDAAAFGLSLVDAGHYFTEAPVCAELARRLAARFPEVEVLLEQDHKDPMKFFKIS